MIYKYLHEDLNQYIDCVRLLNTFSTAREIRCMSNINPHYSATLLLDDQLKILGCKTTDTHLAQTILSF